MQVTDVNLKMMNSGNKMKAIADVYFDDEFVVHGVKVIEGTNGLFIAMPSRKTLNGKPKDIAHPIKQEARTKIEEAVFERYNAQEVEGATEESNAEESAE